MMLSRKVSVFSLSTTKAILASTVRICNSGEPDDGAKRQGEWTTNKREREKMLERLIFKRTV